MILRRTILLALLAFYCAVLTNSARAEVRLHSLFTDNMVLQRDMKVPVWGTATAGEKVMVVIGDQMAETTASGGEWRVELPAMTAGGPLTLMVTGSNTIKLENVLIGDVWICSGQSNMQWPIAASADPEQTIAESSNPNIRLFTVPRVRKDQPQESVQGEWVECGPQTTAQFSAVAYHFGQALQKKLDVPIGLLSTNFGGTAAEEWTSDEALKSKPETANLAGKGNSSKLHNAMIHPLLPFAIRGAIWYQGESNAGRAYQYRTLFPLMIGNWREVWGQGDFPFLFVQLAPFTPIRTEPGESDWAELREAQLMTMLNVPNTAMVVITDVGDEKDIHPKQKKPVGERLALAARKLAYGEDLVYSGPIYESMRVDGNKVVLKFKHVGDGLTVQGDKLKGFTIAGQDKKFYNADAEVAGDTVVVHSDRVEEPVAVRYGWDNYPVVNLANKNGLLASPFRTDEFPGVTTDRK